jgi:hypothetical protein
MSATVTDGNGRQAAPAAGAPRQAAALAFVREFAASRGRPPTSVELARALVPPVRAQSASRLLDKLRAAGHIGADGRMTPAAVEAAALRALLADVRAWLGPLAICQGDRPAKIALVARIGAALGERA